MRKLVGVGIIGILIGAAGWLAHRAPAADRDPAPAARGKAARADDPAPGGVKVTAAEAKQMGLAVTALRAARHAPQIETTAVVLSPQSLGNLSAAYVAEAGRLAVARAALVAARNEYQRQKKLYGEDQTTSLKALQAAESAFVSDRAQARTARLQLRLDAVAVGQQWGPVVRNWMVTRSAAFERVLDERDWLVEVTLDSRAAEARMRVVRLVAPTGVAVSGRLVSTFPQTNPTIQGLNFLYVIPARAGFAPGLNLVAQIPAGAAERGVVVPEAAVIWTAGQAWAYRETASDEFERVRVSTAEPVGTGWFVRTGFAAGDRVVTRAAEELFSAETQPASGGGDAGDDD